MPNVLQMSSFHAVKHHREEVKRVGRKCTALHYRSQRLRIKGHYIEWDFRVVNNGVTKVTHSHDVWVIGARAEMCLILNRLRRSSDPIRAGI